jgi:glutamate formiminotransferase / 5-formyltetrahydrofolate cyclo-ligase
LTLGESILVAVPNLSLQPGQELDARSGEAMDVYVDEDHARAVVTYGGLPRSVLESCIALCRWAVRSLNLEDHAGVHPRFGVVDVLPLIPYRTPEAVLRELANDLGCQIELLGAPVYRYGRADPEGRSLPELRRFLRTTPHRSHPTAGVVCLGIRDPLVAFNVNFEGDVRVARSVARDVRAPEIRALEFELDSRGLVQVSMNLIDPETVGPKAAFDRVVVLAKERGLELVDCEVVGLVPHPILEQLEGLPLRAPVRSIEQALEDKGLL